MTGEDSGKQESGGVAFDTSHILEQLDRIILQTDQTIQSVNQVCTCNLFLVSLDVLVSSSLEAAAASFSNICMEHASTRASCKHALAATRASCNHALAATRASCKLQ